MARYDFRSPRLYVDAALAGGTTVALDRSQAHYLQNVLRLKAGDPVLVFNGRDGEWRATLAVAGRRDAALAVGEQTRGQPAPGDLHYLFAPLKHARLDYMVQKAVEMGASRLQPVLTRHSQAERIKLERMQANAIEAAEQCGILTLPEIAAPAPLAQVLASFDASRLLVFCDEDAEVKDPVAALTAAARSGYARPSRGAHRSGRRFRGRGTCRLVGAAARRAALARPSHTARRHRRGRGSDPCWRRAVRLSLARNLHGTRGHSQRYQRPGSVQNP